MEAHNEELNCTPTCGDWNWANVLLLVLKPFRITKDSIWDGVWYCNIMVIVIIELAIGQVVVLVGITVLRIFDLEPYPFYINRAWISNLSEHALHWVHLNRLGCPILWHGFFEQISVKSSKLINKFFLLFISCNGNNWNFCKSIYFTVTPFLLGEILVVQLLLIWRKIYPYQVNGLEELECLGNTGGLFVSTGLWNKFCYVNVKFVLAHKSVTHESYFMGFLLKPYFLW